MEATIRKKPTMFRLDEELVTRLKELAKREHRSLNNFVECVLFDVVYNEPNEITKAAMEEAKSGKLRGTTPVDTTSVESMFKSAGL
ncbi:MAG: ribbon-helix-helix protein, CopG family [Muribaculaceae bacterium]|nr:ribbon-helix-helix protein, CopG family [Muribaculaceae bacterium]